MPRSAGYIPQHVQSSEVNECHASVHTHGYVQRPPRRRAKLACESSFGVPFPEPETALPAPIDGADEGDLGRGEIVRLGAS